MAKKNQDWASQGLRALFAQINDDVKNGIGAEAEKQFTANAKKNADKGKVQTKKQGHKP